MAEAKRRRAQYFRPCVDAFEDKVLLNAAANIWLNTDKNGLWSDGNDWSQTHVPNQHEIATFTNASSTNVTLSSDTTIYGLDVEPGYGSKIYLNGSVEVTNTMTLADPSSFLFNNNEFKFDGQNDGTGQSTPFNWIGGTITTTSGGLGQVFIIAPNAKVVLGDLKTNNTLTVNGAVIDDYGITSWQGPGNLQLSGGALWDNHSGSSFTVSAA